MTYKEALENYKLGVTGVQNDIDTLASMGITDSRVNNLRSQLLTKQSGQNYANLKNAYIAENPNGTFSPEFLEYAKLAGDKDIVNTQISKGVLTQNSAIQQEAVNKAGVAAGTLVEIKTPGGGIAYVQKGSYGEANIPNLGTNNTSAQANITSSGGRSPEALVGAIQTFTNTPQNTPSYDKTTGFLTDYGKSIGAKPVQPNDPASVSQGTQYNLGNINLQRGSKGKEVEELQKALNAQGANLKVDGDFGPATQEAVRNYQEKNGIKKDGIVGQQTLATLNGIQNAPLSPVNQTITSAVTDNPQNNQLYNTLTPELKSLFDTLTMQISSMVESGKKVNPDLTITPEMTARFLEEATNELDPYYKELIRQNQQDLSVSFRTLQEDYNKQIAREQPAFQQNLEAQDTSEAERGLAFSSGRVEREQQTIQGQQNKLDDYFTTAQRDIESKGLVAERKLGSRNFSELGVPTLQQYATQPRTISPSGQFSSTSSRQLFSPQGGLFGELPGQAKTAIATRTSGLEEIERKKRILDAGGMLGSTSLG